MKEKGFTLIELLAVIVVLATILIIAVPRVTKIIDGTKKSAFVSSAKLIGKAVQNDALETGSRVYKIDGDGKLTTDNRNVAVK